MVAIVCFFIVAAFTIELYWLIFHSSLAARSHFDVVAYLFGIYGQGDAAYFDQVTPLTLGLESINVFFTQWLHVWLLYAILRKRPYRFALQLGVASYVAYSVVLYFWESYLSGWQYMRSTAPLILALYVAVNLPWLLGNLYVAWHAGVRITRRFAG